MNMHYDARPDAFLAPIGYFVHHQGRGHAERCAAIVNALPRSRPVTVFAARSDIFPPMRPNVEFRPIPSLFEATGAERAADWVTTPRTLHCAPLGWPGIRKAMAAMAGWFGDADPALIVTDVSAEVAQLARICSVPHVAVIQHGRRGDCGHLAAYEGAAGILAPFSDALAQRDWPGWQRRKTGFFPGLGLSRRLPARAVARRRLGIPESCRMVLVMSGAGGNGWAAAPLAVGARSDDEALWVTIGAVKRDWHATEPANLRHDGWTDAAADYLSAADIVVSSTGNTTTHQILAAGKPWIAVPEWRYFDEQVEKARALARAGAAIHLGALPASADAWRRAIRRAARAHDPGRQRALVSAEPDKAAAAWIEALIGRLRPGDGMAMHAPRSERTAKRRPAVEDAPISHGNTEGTP